MSVLKMLVFSFERPLQLAATLESFKLHCKSKPDITVYTKDCSKLKPNEFKQDVLSELKGYEFILFCVDDTIFINPFDFECLWILGIDREAIGFSLRLGLNTSRCYMKDCVQKVPETTRYKWTRAEQDFGYPLEISSSVYRTADIKRVIENCEFGTPNTLEMMMHRNRLRLKKDFLWCYPRSVAVSVPFNKVQRDFPNNRSMKYTPHYFKVLYEQGKRIDVGEYAGTVTNAVHQELPLMLKGA